MMGDSMTKLYWRERDAGPTPCAFRYLKNCNEMAAYDKVRQVTYVKFFDRRGLSWLNLENIVHVCRAHMESDEEYIQKLEFGRPVVYGANRAPVKPTMGLHMGSHATSVDSLVMHEQGAGR